MTTKLVILNSQADSSEALELLVSRQIRHLPILDEDGSLVGLLSVRRLLKHHAEDLVDQLNSLEAYFTADGPGG